MTDTTWICSFDIGKKNFAFCIEEIDKKRLLEVKNIPKSKRYNVDGTLTETMDSLLKEVYHCGKIILFKNSDLTKNCSSKKSLDPETYYNMYDLLNEYKEYWDKCSVFIVEQQVSFRKKTNIMALKLGQHCYSYFVFRYSRTKKVIEFPAYHKTCVLGLPKLAGKTTKKGKVKYKSMIKYQRKKWSVNKAIEILKFRGDDDTLTLLTSAKKKDDLADVLTQAIAWTYLNFVDKN